ncbi:putative butyrate kinase [Singulisphaera acidiphila DSM 18658]|uniref:Putative butyrate kinase n=1 Tax=Singulisphaera acidiphila (strain ATCC BAA-1392 / DSM 18658 / VKM B-2454 / MOB10) TaxID=886293 RepID=L0DIM7_SINAD|nr:putative butyrate kinase [Singulisphaera acidiphila DSM 18658]
MVRVVGTDPGTSSLDLLLLADGAVVGQERLSPGTLQRDPEALVSLLRAWLPIDLIAGPSGYGLPLVRGEALTERHLEEMSLVRPDQRGIDAGVLGFRSWVRALATSGLPVLFLPGGVHLPSIPAYRKANTIDLGTADKVAVTALALQADAADRGADFSESTFAVVELGSAFSAVMIVSRGRLVDAAAGTRGPIGVRSGGCWDGEVAYWRSPLSKESLFRGGLIDLGPEGPDAFRESLTKHVAGLKAVTPFDRIYLSGALAERPDLAALARAALEPLGTLIPLRSLSGAWVKHAAQGAALLADGLAGGHHAGLVASLELANASGTVWDGLRG